MIFEISGQTFVFSSEDTQDMLNKYNGFVKQGFQKIPYTLYTLLKQGIKNNEKILIRRRTLGDNFVFITHGIEYDINDKNDTDFYNWFYSHYWTYRATYIDTGVAIINNDYNNNKIKIAINNKNSDLYTINYNEKENKENDIMKGFNFDFGPVTGDVVRISAYGLAVKNQAGEWVSYNSATNEIFNVDLLNFDASKFVYKMPVAIKDVAVGDVIIHNKIAVFVTAIEDKVIVAIDPRSGEEKRVLLTRSPFGFDYATKLVSFLTMFNNTATADNPFGGFLPFMLMGEGETVDPMAMLLMMQSQGGGTALFSNPMMMYFLMKDNGNKDMVLPLMMMSQMNK